MADPKASDQDDDSAKVLDPKGSSDVSSGAPLTGDKDGDPAQDVVDASATEETKQAGTTDDGDEEAAPSGERKSRRGRKAVEVIYQVETPKEKTKFVVSKGKGKALGEIDMIETYVKKTSPENLKPLHALLFGRKGAAKTIRSNIRTFSGLVYTGEQPRAEVLEKKEKWMDGQKLALLKSFGSTFGVQTGGTKAELIERLKEFLDKPSALKTRAAPKQTTTPKKATPKKSAKPMTGWDLYQRERRPAQANYEPDKTTSEITATLQSMWKSESAASKGKYEAMAKAYAKTKKKATQKKSPAKKTAPKSKKKTPKSSELVENEDSDAGEEMEADDGDAADEETASTKRKAEPDEGRESKKAKGADAGEADDDADDDADDEGQHTGLEPADIVRVKELITAFLTDHENYKEVRAKQVRNMLVDKMPSLELTPKVKTFVQNFAIRICDSLGGE